MLHKPNFRKKSFLLALILINLALTACTPSTNQPLDTSRVTNAAATFQKQSGVDYSKAIVVTNPKIEEAKYVNENYTKYLTAAQTALKQAAPNQTFSDAAITAQAKVLAQKTAADNLHFKYITDRSVSLNWTTLKPGSLFYGGAYGTGWIVDRFKNPDGSWSNDFLVGTNIHVINTISDGASSDIGKSNLYKGFPSDVYELGINNQVYNPQNPDLNWMYPSSFAKLPNWDPKNYFTPQRRALVNQIENNYQVNPYYSFAFSGPLWRRQYFKREIGQDAKNFVKSFLMRPHKPPIPNTHWYNVGHLLNDLLDEIAGSQQYFNQLFFDQSNIGEVSQNTWKDFYEKYQEKLDTQLIHDEANKISNQAKTLDNGYLKITIPDAVLARKLPVFLDPSKYNEWTFPKFVQEDAFKNYSFHNYQQSYGFFQGQSKAYNLLPKQQEPIWHAGYPAEQTWNGLAYRSPGPILKTNQGLITHAIFLNPLSKKHLDHNECQIYNGLCNDDGVAPAVYSLGSQDSNTGGGSSGSMALNKNYEVQGIYWGVQFNFGSLLNYNSLGLYEPMYSSSKLNLPTFERIRALTTKNKGAFTYWPGIDGDDTKKPQPFKQGFSSYLRTGLQKVFIAKQTDETYAQILELNQLKSFNYSTSLDTQLKTVMGSLTNSNPSDLSDANFTSLSSNLNGFADPDLHDRLYTAIKVYWQNFFHETRRARSGYKAQFRQGFGLASAILNNTINNTMKKFRTNRALAAVDFTAFVKRDLGTVNMAAELQKYFHENNYKSYVYNNLANPLKIVDEQK